jgi:ArsR family transcriptional regulator
MEQPLVPTDQLDAVAQRFRLLGEPVRLELLNALHARGELSVGELVEITGHRQANVSKHLGLMADDGLLTRTRDGVHVYYAIDDPTLSALCLLVSTQRAEEAKQAG